MIYLFSINEVDLFSTDNLTDKEKETLEKQKEIERKEVEKQFDPEEKHIYFSGDNKRRIKKMNTLTIVEKGDITRRTNKPTTLKMNANPLRQHIDLQNKLNSNKNLFNPLPKKEVTQKKFETSKTIYNKFDLRKSSTFNNNILNKK